MSYHGLACPRGSPADAAVCTGNGSGGGNANNVMASSANPMNFTENQQGNVVLEKLRQQRESGRFCDVVLVVQDKQFPAHRNILAACSPYFDSILRMHKVVKELVTVTCQSADVFELLLNYMYSGNVVIDRHNVTELLKLAHNFLVSKLKNYCAEYLDRYLDAQNCLCVKDLAEKYNMPGLAKNAAHFVETNINAVLADSHDALEYPICRAEALISERSFPNVTFEAQLHFVTRYVAHRPDERETHFATLLSSIRANSRRRPGSTAFPALLEFVDREPLFRRRSSILLTLLHYARDNGLRALYSECDRLYRSLTTTTSGGCASDVSVYLNNGHVGDEDGEEESGCSVAATKARSADEFEPSSVALQRGNESKLAPPVACGSNPVHELCSPSSSKMSAATVRVKLEPPDTPPPPGRVVGESNALSAGRSSTAASTDLPPLRIKLRLSERPSASKETDDLTGKRKSNSARSQGPLIEADQADDVGSVCNTSGQLLKRGRVSISRSQSSRVPAKSVNESQRDGGGGFDGMNSVDPAGLCLEERARESPVTDSSDEETGDYEDNFSSSDEEDEGRKEETKAEILFKCPHCVYTSGSQSRIQSHIEKAHSKNRTFSCTVCPFECKWNREYYTHMKEHFQGPPFCCDSCDYVAERIQMLLTHRMKHTDERPFQCKQCDYRCRTKTNLVAHVRSHTGEKPFTCPSCFRSFAIKSTLDQHLATHSDARPFVCDQCSFSTKYQSHLISHKRIHTGDVFYCQYPDCSYSSPKKSQLAAHMRTHMAVRAHVCKQCGRSFIEKSHLVRHERIHLQVKPFKCDQCNYASSRRDKLKEHVQKHHVPGANSSTHYKGQSIGGAKGPFSRAGRRGGRNRRLSFVFGADGARNRRLSSGGRISTALTLGRPHSSMGFRPITPQVVRVVQNGPPASTIPAPVSPTANNAVAGHGGSLMDFSGLMSSPTCGGDTMVPLVTGHAYQPSPFEGGAALNDGDVLLSTRAGCLLMSDSPQSTTNSLLSDPFPSAATPVSDPLQRPMSLPPLGAQAGVNGDFNLLNSFMAMF